MLRVLGVDAPDERVYRVLVARASASLPELATELHADPTDLGRSLDRLVAYGLVARSAGDSDRYVAAPPASAIGALVEERRGDLNQVEHAVAALAEQYRRAVGGRTVGELIEVVSGADAVAYRTAQARRAAASEVATFLPAPGAVSGTEPVPVAHGVVCRIVLARGVLEHPAAMAPVQAAIRAGERIRVADRLPLRMVLADRSVAVVPLAGDGDSGAILVHRSGLLDALVALFDAVWVTAVPLLGPDQDFPDPAAGIDDEDGRILSLLLVGLTDRSVASQLGLSLRTVQRRVRHLMDLAGVETRLQLGWYAARHDWV